jgi:nicotinamidase-related amidase
MFKRALLVIDVQKYYINEFTKEIPFLIEKYIKQNSIDYILFSKFINHENSNMFKVFKWGKMMTPDHTDICDNLMQFVNSENVFQKDTYSVFKSEKFRDFLTKNNIGDLTLCGLDADACILATAYEGFDLGYEIQVIDELTGCHVGEEFRKHGLAIINKNLQKK